MKRFAIAFGVWLLVTGCSGSPRVKVPPPPTNHSPVAVEGLRGLPHVFRLSSRVYSGGEPDGERGFRELRAMGVNTIISVDGKMPDVEGAAKHDLRYVHLPVGYDGIAPGRQLEIIKAVRDLPAPFYIHCHKGLHRGPTAACLAELGNDAWTPQEAVAAMQKLGTGEHYKGLYRVASQYVAPEPGILEAVTTDFPASSIVSSMTRAMAHVGESWDGIEACQKAGWTTPADHPDLEPAHQALLLREALHEIPRTIDLRRRSEDFRERLARIEVDVQELESSVRVRNHEMANAHAAEVRKACAGCHERYRD